MNALIVGDSYGYGLMDALARSRLCQTLQYWHNMNTFYDCEEGSYESREHRILPCHDRLGNFQSNDENGKRFLAGKNVVIMIMTGFNIDNMSWGFDRLINRLYGDPNDNLSSSIPAFRYEDRKTAQDIYSCRRPMPADFPLGFPGSFLHAVRECEQAVES